MKKKVNKKTKQIKKQTIKECIYSGLLGIFFAIFIIIGF